jgi:hypothetical protein
VHELCESGEYLSLRTVAPAAFNIGIGKGPTRQRGCDRRACCSPNGSGRKTQIDNTAKIPKRLVKKIHLVADNVF